MSDTSSCNSSESDSDYSSVSSLSESHYICSSSDNDEIPDDGVDISVKTRKLYVKHMHSYTTKTSKENDSRIQESKQVLQKIRQRIKGAKRMHRLYIRRIIQLKKIIRDLRRSKFNKLPAAKKRKYFVKDVKKIN